MHSLKSIWQEVVILKESVAVGLFGDIKSSN